VKSLLFAVAAGFVAHTPLLLAAVVPVLAVAVAAETALIVHRVRRHRSVPQ
jgi:hypothetical protein